MQNKVIVIFQDNLKIGAILTFVPETGLFRTAFFNTFSENDLTLFKEAIQAESLPTVKYIFADGQRIAKVTEVYKTDIGYVQAATEELNRLNLLSAAVDPAVQDLLIKYDQAELTLEQRQEMLGDLINADQEMAKDMLEALNE
ncbi:MAG: hypothetical protein JWO40_587 [Candidatus Doudnabacteria bacterium]|nr:hypothetical protein [Candidatus Doudnabacteria bacterium]